MGYLKKLFGHIKTVMKHKHWVFFYMRKLGYPVRGILHDMSKFSPEEFFESVRFWNGEKSPILGAKASQGISYAWQHHKGRNKHHYEYWVDNLDDGGLARKMPFKYVIELVCDWLAAGKSYAGYNGENIFSKETEWWYEKRKTAKIHPETSKLITKILWHMSQTATYWESTGSGISVGRVERKTLRTIKRFLKNWRKEYDD